MCNINYVPLLYCNFHHKNEILLLRQWCHHDSLDDNILKERAAYITRVQKFMTPWMHVVWCHVLCRKTDRSLYPSLAFFHSVFCCVGNSVTAHVRLALVQGCDKCLSLLWGLSGLTAALRVPHRSSAGGSFPSELHSWFPSRQHNTSKYGQTRLLTCLSPRKK